ncbi:hypothetical protein [Vibrio crassostreae]|jgi:hypothetical protein|nr:hypothetical protein [Vibrio crassostreae]CDT39824.1 hypothetical protein VCRLGP8_240086 [Vibrio crassostreae]
MVTQGISIIQVGCVEATFDLFTAFEGVLKAKVQGGAFSICF